MDRKSLARVVFVTVVILSGMVSASAITKQEYAASVDAAFNLVLELETKLASFRFEDGEVVPLDDDVAAILSQMPSTVSVETGNGSIDVSNNWLHERLAAFNASSDIDQKAMVLVEVRERLTAIMAAVAEIDGDAVGRSKDEEKRKLAEILAREEYQRTMKPEESRFEKWLTSILEWFSGLFPSGQGAASPMPVLGPAAWVLRLIIIAGIVLILGFGLYKLVPLLFPSFALRTEERGERLILGETIAADQHAATLFEDAERAAREGDLRLAIRKGYIAVLCELADRRLIGLARYKTNRDYLRAVRDRQPLYGDLQEMTESFERHWYGRETGDLESWNTFRNSYRNVVKEAGAGS